MLLSGGKRVLVETISSKSTLEGVSKNDDFRDIVTPFRHEKKISFRNRQNNFSSRQAGRSKDDRFAVVKKGTKI